MTSSLGSRTRSSASAARRLADRALARLVIWATAFLNEAVENADVADDGTDVEVKAGVVGVKPGVVSERLGSTCCPKCCKACWAMLDVVSLAGALGIYL